MTPTGKLHGTFSFLDKDVGDGKSFPSVPLGVGLVRPLAATRARRVAAVDEIATGLGDVTQDLRAITGLEHDRLRVFPRLVHVFLLSCLQSLLLPWVENPPWISI